ncbi:MAG TPA: H-NS histone family protein [Hyphomicrobiaceae bacterium]|nr:H-NS histone family protein [Hyphomicrobiaceae bacterium]
MAAQELFGMARITDVDKMSYAELVEMEARIARLIVEKRDAERAALKEQVAALARESGFDIRDLIGGGKRKNGPVAIKYRDPQNPENTWTGRGRMPRWMAQATKGGKVKKEAFLIE